MENLLFLGVPILKHIRVVLPVIHSSSFGIVFVFLCKSQAMHAFTCDVLPTESKLPLSVDLDFLYICWS